MQPQINGKSVERSYAEYREDIYVVNRRYQRKLVWTITEKQEFIDSLINGYPVPLFLFAVVGYRDKKSNEIIDGMQRLNAIFDFLENDYSTSDGYYFDLDTTATTKMLKDEGKLTQKMPVLPRQYCVDIARYELPFSIYKEENTEVIDEVFRRINSNGKHLSRQEIRQAGATNAFANIVRKIAVALRGDVSHADILLLSKMPEISIQQSGGRGIKPDDVFWVRENIISRKDLRQSQDEEIIADLIAAMILPNMPPSGVEERDSYYRDDDMNSDTKGRRLDEQISKIGEERIIEQFLYVIDEVRKMFSYCPLSIIRFLTPDEKHRGPRYFQILFLSLYRLLIKNNRKIINYEKLLDCLENISEKTMQISEGGGNWSAKQKEELVKKTIALIEEKTVARNANDPMLNSYTTEIETLLGQAKTENAQYDFKQGIHNLSDGSKNEKMIEKIFLTLSAMGNSEDCAVGYILIGVSDNESDMKQVEMKYGIKSVKVKNFYITGVDGEAGLYYKSLDDYFRRIKNYLEIMPFTDYYKRQIGSMMKMVDYNNRSIIILKIVSNNGPVSFGDKFYTRMGANTNPEPVGINDLPQFIKKFKN
ncbi:DUF262 domain-containing protein [Selenomonas ruminantium]|uniref:GmrSD restriction endonuclease domain-containing protein n=1 Tax=Selenomonas ruminantium TaxID=971 RepID=UPI0026EE9233|nr:DUF262 domain-containing protein [Selenomonas ruminantium]